MAFLSNPPLSLYLHLPWCERKCPYCDFNSYEADSIDEDAYIRALIEDLMQDLPLVWGRQLSSIFIGGGTPSLFSSAAINQLMSELRACLNFNPAIEVTMECNPGSADESHFAGYREAGINRLSIGVQSFADDKLQALGRVHDRQQAISAYQQARRAGFDTINLDLMYGLPGQTLQQALDDMTMAIELQPEHISHYQLTIEPNTLFHARPPANLPDNDLAWDMQQACIGLLEQDGLHHYEISAYARTGQQCQHNVNYWQFGDYLGLGAGAHGKITLAGENRILRRVRSRQPKAYLEQHGDARISQQTELDKPDRVFEFMLNALRLVQGFDLALFSERTALPKGILDEPLFRAQELGLIDLVQQRVQPTTRGLQFHNDLQALFLDIDCDGVTPNQADIFRHQP